MKNIISVLLLLLSCCVSYSQWTVQQFYPNYNDVFFFGTTGYAVGNSGIIRKSTDSGLTWQNQSASGYSSYDLNAVTFFDANTGWIAHSGTTVLKTTNGGTNWITQITGVTNPMYDIDFANQVLGIACGTVGKIIRTVDGGSTWSSQTLGAVTLNSVFFSSPVYLASDDGKVYTSADAGVTWTLHNTTTSNRLLSVASFGGITLACGANGIITRSTDAGVTWTTVPSGVSYLLNSVTFYTSSIVLIASANGSILRSTDAGNSFTLVSPVSSASLDEVRIISANTLIAVGDRGQIKYTTNAGINWSVSIGSDQSVNSIYFLNGATGYAANNEGILYRTNDGGTTWSSGSLLNGYSLYDVKFENSSTGFVCGTSNTGVGVIAKTTNSGASWTPTTFAGTNNVSDISFGVVGTGYGIGSNAAMNNGTTTYLYKTTDDGVTWSTAFTFTGFMRDVNFPSALTGWVCGDNGSVLRTTNGGVNWVQQTTPNIQDLYAIYFLNTSQGYACGAVGTIIATTNGGANWSLQSITASGTNPYFYDIHFGSSSNGAAVGDGGYRYRTTNGGTTWTYTLDPTLISFNAVCFTSPPTIYSGGDFSYIGNFGGIVGVSNSTNEIPSQFGLSQNYPNPFNPITKIKFDISGTSVAQTFLSVYDILGRKITTLVNESLEPGTYEIEWNAANFPSGVYFYKLTAGDYVQTKKMMLIK